MDIEDNVDLHRGLVTWHVHGTGNTSTTLRPGEWVLGREKGLADWTVEVCLGGQVS